MTVTELLAQARAAHMDYRRLDSTRVNRAAKQAAIARAQDFRSQAHEADPDHADLAWSLDTIPHAELMAFYARYLG